MVNLEFPPHVVALGCIYLAALLTSYEQTPSPDRPDVAVSNQIIAQLDKPGAWERQFQTRVEDLEGAGDYLIFPAARGLTGHRRGRICGDRLAHRSITNPPAEYVSYDTVLALSASQSCAGGGECRHTIAPI